MTIGPVLARNGSVLGQLWRTILGRSNANVQNGTGPLLAADIGPIVEPALGQHRASYGMFAGKTKKCSFCPVLIFEVKEEDCSPH